MGVLLLKYDDYPESCPPVLATCLEGTYYRLCKSDEYSKEDFLTHVDAGLPFPPQKQCEALALSFYDSIENANKLRRKFKKFRMHSIKPVQILESYGVALLENQTGHLNLWEYKNIDIFKDVTREGEGNHE